MLIHFRVKSAEVVHAEVAECRPLVVDKETSVFYGRFFGYHAVAGGDPEGCHSRRFDIEPVDKRGDPEHLRKLEKTVDRAALVAARYYKRAAYDFQLIYFALSVYITCINADIPDQLIARNTDADGRLEP